MTELVPVVEQPKVQRKHPMAKCEECPLAAAQGKFVPSKIPVRAKLAVVGEAPGPKEVKTKECFTGPSGKLLDIVLQENGYHRHEVLYTNVTLCRPVADGAAPKAAIDACKPRLVDELRASGVDDVVALGGVAASALVDDTRTITRLRVGPPKKPSHSLRDTNVKRIVPTWHTAYCLRNADAFPSLVTDLNKLKNGSLNVWTPPDWRYYDDVPSALLVIEELQRTARDLVVDIEVGIEKDISFGHPNEYDLLCVGIAYARNKAVVLGTVPLANKTVLDALRRLFRNKPLIAHNGKFDLAGLYPTLGPLELAFDTMLAHYAIDERPGNHGLKVLAVELLGAPQYDDEIKQYVHGKNSSYANIPRELLYKYNAYDVACTWALWELFNEQLDNDTADWPYPDLPVKTLRDVHDHMVRASNQLMFPEINGITIDLPYQRELRRIFIDRLGYIEDQLDEAVSEGVYEGTVEGEIVPVDQEQHRWTNHINPRSPKQVNAYLKSQGVTVSSTDKETIEKVLEILYRQGHSESFVFKFCKLLLEHRKEAKKFGTFVEGIRKRLHKGRVHTTYMLHGTSSGRLASRNPNLQNVIRDKVIRKQWTVSKPGNVLIQCDYKQAEGRVIATLAKDEYLRNVFLDPTADIFNTLSDGLYGSGNWTKEERVRTKAFFYGIGYGREPYSIGLEFNMPPSLASQTYNDFMDLIPNVAAWQGVIRETVLRGQDLITPFGRRRRFMLITNENRKSVLNEALSFLPQSTASDICLSAAIALRPMLRGHGFLRLTIHDALVTECPEDKADYVSGLMREVMEAKGREFTDYVPFTVDTSMGTNWGEL